MSEQLPNSPHYFLTCLTRPQVNGSIFWFAVQNTCRSELAQATMSSNFNSIGGC
jgi:hypothetical protein